MGALYFLYIAWTTWRVAKILIKGRPKPRTYAFRDGLLTNLSNPKPVLFAAAVLIVIFPPDMTMLENRFLLINHFLIKVLFYGILAFVMSAEAVSEALPSYRSVPRRICGSYVWRSGIAPSIPTLKVGHNYIT